MRSLGLIGGLAGFTGALLYLAGAGAAPAAPILTGLGPLPFFIATLGWGNLAGLAAAGSALLSVLAIMGLVMGGGPSIALAHAISFALTAIIPALWLSHLALLRRPIVVGDPNAPVEWYPLGRLLLWLTGIACAGYLALEILAYAVSGAGLPTVIARYFDQIIPGDVRAALLTQFKPIGWAALLNLLAHILPAMGGIFWQIWIAANGIGAYSLLAATGRCARPRTGWHGLALPRAYAVPFFLALAIGLAGHETGSIGLTLAALLFVPYFFLGLCVVHAIPVQGPGRVALLGLFYFLLLLQAWLAIPVGVIGLLEQWSGLRARLLRGPGQEDK